MAGVLFSVMLVASGFADEGAAGRWYAGTWDSWVYVLTDHPKTLALRVEVEDQDSGLTLSDVEIRLEGVWEEVQKFSNSITRQYRVSAITDRRGIAVFGLSFRKGSEFEGGYDVPLDGIEKVQRISARKRGYALASGPLNFAALSKDPKQAWKQLIMDTPGARYFLLRLGESFRGYEKEFCREPAFFERIRDEDYGDVFPAKADTGSDFPTRFIRSNPQAEAGPFMMLPIVIKMQRLSQGIGVEMEPRPGIGPITSERSQREPMGERTFESVRTPERRTDASGGNEPKAEPSYAEIVQYLKDTLADIDRDDDLAVRIDEDRHELDIILGSAKSRHLMVNLKLKMIKSVGIAGNTVLITGDEQDVQGANLSNRPIKT
ncbi:MAG: hypothetical protein FJ088_14380, partial [Deltaproteobacteria bacterium]|nr:hypothetical protein [Deltaproteobacteria bacterium]